MTEPLIAPASAIDFDIRSLPKVSLHDHLDGGLRPATIIDLAAGIGHILPSSDPVALAEWFRESADSGSLERYLETFEHTIAVMQTAGSLARVAQEFVEDLAADGVVYGEIRWAPEQHLRHELSLDEAVDAVQAGLDAGVDLVSAGGRQIKVGQLITAMRHADRSMEIAELAVRHRDTGAVGFDIAGAEAGFPASRFTAAFTYLAENHFPVTVHAGEAAGLDSINDALLNGRALRLGHGVRIAEDIQIAFANDPDADDEEGSVGLVTLGGTAAWVRDRGIPLEICPSSNLQTGAVAAFGEDIADHPVDLLYQTGFFVTINPDNRLMSGATLTDELELLVDAFDYDLDALEALMLNAAAASFQSLEDREALAEVISSGFQSAGI